MRPPRWCGNTPDYTGIARDDLAAVGPVLLAGGAAAWLGAVGPARRAARRATLVGGAFWLAATGFARSWW